MDIYDEATAALRRDHRGTPTWAPGRDSRWTCSCGASGGGWSARSTDWQRGHRQHLRAAYRRILADLRGEPR